MKRGIFLTAVGAVLVVATVLGGSRVLAQNSSGQYSSIIQKLAQRFNLNPADIQTVFNQDRADKQAQIQNRFSQTLDQTVKNGKLTDAQKQLILSKLQELKNNQQNLKNMTPDQRKAALQKQRQDLQAWAQQNNIDMKYLFGGHMGMMGGHWEFGKRG